MSTVQLKTGHRYSAEDRRQQILQTATQLFARQGFSSTTTRQIAERAQVNEAIIFRHFPSKEDLYWAVLEHKCGPRRGQRVIEQLGRNAPLEEIFRDIAREYLQVRQQDSSMTRLLLFSALEHHELSDRFFHAHVADFYESVTQFIREQIRAGRFRAVDPLLAARSFWGMLVYHVLMQELFGHRQFQEIDLDQASRAISDIWLNGMLPRKESTEVHKPERKRAGRATPRPRPGSRNLGGKKK